MPKAKLAREYFFYHPRKTFFQRYLFNFFFTTAPTLSANLIRHSNECKLLRGQFGANIG